MHMCAWCKKHPRTGSRQVAMWGAPGVLVSSNQGEGVGAADGATRVRQGKHDGCGKGGLPRGWALERKGASAAQKEGEACRQCALWYRRQARGLCCTATAAGAKAMHASRVHASRVQAYTAARQRRRRPSAAKAQHQDMHACPVFECPCKRQRRHQAVRPLLVVMFTSHAVACLTCSS